ncbi:CNP1-like family protein [Nitrosomonas sp. ANs5]|uniref:CNP1-like family protein n=1 Tax=Nitrosomonas sp. ANs5 TaxID=3423941 RepID=UPI003D353511
MKTAYRLFLCLFLTACASSSEFIDTLDHNRDWAAIQPHLPAYPQSENLLEFDAGPARTLRYFIDADSISVDEKRIIRYSLIIRSAQGAENVSYEGLRCETREHKRYALGNSDTREWVRARVSAWQPLEHVAQLHAQKELAKYYFCPRGLVVGSASEAIRALKAGIHPKLER